MFSNIFITKLNSKQTINLKNNQKVNVYVVANDKNNINKDLKIVLKNNNIVNIYCLILASANKKEIDFNLFHEGNNSISNIYVKALANRKSSVKVNCVSYAKKATKKNEINQMIDGLMFDDKSSIRALPCLDINIDNVIARHTVNIGQVDPEIIFYLNSKGLSTTKAYQFLIDSFITDLKPYLSKYKININKDIKKLMEAKYE